MYLVPEVSMRKLIIILITFIAVVTFIRAFENTGNMNIRNNPAVSGNPPEVFTN